MTGHGAESTATVVMTAGISRNKKPRCERGQKFRKFEQCKLYTTTKVTPIRF